jgi:hypothetical protein
MRTKALLLLGIIAGGAPPVLATGAGLPTFDPLRYASTTRQIVVFTEKVKQFEAIIQATKQQMEMLSNLNSAIVSVRGMSPGGVQGGLGIGSSGVSSLFGSTALEDFNAIGGIARDASSLVHDINALSDQAKHALASVGLNTNQLSSFLTTGVHYDTMATLDVDDWKSALNPFANQTFNSTSLGVAAHMGAQQSGTDVRPLYAQAVISLSPADKVRLSAHIGIGLASLDVTAWVGNTNGRNQRFLQLQNVNNGLLKNLAAPQSLSSETVKQTGVEAAGALHDTTEINMFNEGRKVEQTATNADLEARQRADARRAAAQAASVASPQ